MTAIIGQPAPSAPSDLFYAQLCSFISSCLQNHPKNRLSANELMALAAVCTLEWPKWKLLIQVLDNSDDSTSQLLIKNEVHKLQLEGAKNVYRHRVDREGYKAGNLKSAMNFSYVKD